jgi:hypothetical protein
MHSRRDNRAQLWSSRVISHRAVGIQRRDEIQMRDPNKRLTRAVFALSLAVAVPTVTVALATTAGAAACTTANVVSGSNFEIDTNANLAVNGASPCIDWLAGGAGTAMRSSVITHPDKPTGATDDSFGQGTSEDDATPTIVAGSIPPNKSDLKVFGLNQETSGTAKFLELFWSRVQNPSGSTNMDFELNKKFCDPSATPTNCANNGSGVTPETPVRSVGDKLITYDLANGGTVPTISIRTWGGSSWGAATVISGAGGTSLGSVNTAALGATATGGLGNQDAYTFGEAAVSFSSLFPSGGTCGTFGSAYLKSRSSTSFSAEVKDFISPQKVNITNCSSLATSATGATIGGAISDTATISGATAGAGGTITFHLYSTATCTAASEITTGLTAVTVNGNGDYNSGNYTPTAVGTYYWIASYTGDANNSPATGACGDAGESSVVGQVQPGIVTSATASVTIGSPISDTATLSSATSDAGGTITFHLFSTATCTAASEINTGLTAVTVNGNGNYGSGNYTPTSVGTYYWIANYSGDAKNKAANGACGDANESSVVGKAPSTIGTAQTITPQDSATIGASAGGTPTGTVTFKLFGPDNATCAAGGAAAKYTEAVALSGGTASTSNSSFTVNAAASGLYKWLVVYGGDTTHDGVTSTCGTEQFTATITNS